ncbi:MAG: hypothetical protein QM817_04355 [Archangium sp.]
MLSGTWLLNGQPFLSLEASGTGTMEGDAFTWRQEGNALVIATQSGLNERVAFQLAGDLLVLQMGGFPLQLSRDGSTPRGPAAAVAAPVAAVPSAVPSAAGNDELSTLLMSSNWCWLRYSNGNSYTQKLHFAPDGTWRDFSENDIYSRNVHLGSTAHLTGNHQGTGQWRVQNGQLHMSSAETGGQLVTVPLRITRNSNGYPIIHVGDREYCMCR